MAAISFKCRLSPTFSSTCAHGGDCSWSRNLLKILLRIAPTHDCLKKQIPNKHTEVDPVFEGIIVSHDDKHPTASKLSTVNAPADRIVAIGDIHGDINAMRTALRNASIIDAHDKWIGGRAVLVQVGDQLDRGENERAIYELLFKLQDRASAVGGAVHILLGNHELMNARLDFRYVTRGGFEDFGIARASFSSSPKTRGSCSSGKGPSARSSNGSSRVTVSGHDDYLSILKSRKWRPRIAVDDLKMIRALPAAMQARARAIVAGGPLATELGRRTRVGILVGDTLFIHAGLSPRHLTYGGQESSTSVEKLDKINNDTSKFLQGQAPYPSVLNGQSSPVWMRDYSRPGVRQGSAECKMLVDTLRMVGAKRMVVGHTPQAEGINGACGGKVWRIDTGMSKAYGGVPEAIEISRRGHVRIYTENGMVHGSMRCK